MELIASTLHYAASFFVIISVIVFVHEFGHFIVARWCGVKIDVFSIGFGPEIAGWNDRSGTRWKISALPIGGYVKMHGDAGAASTPDDDALERMGPAEKKVSFHFKPLWQKAAIVVAGPLANFILTIAVLTYFIYAGGLSSTEPVVGEIMPDTPAAEAGLQAGDRIVSVDGTQVESFGDIPALIATNLGTPVKLVLLREQHELTLSITPQAFEDTDELGNPIKRPLIGIKSTKVTFEDVSVPEALWEAAKRTYMLCEMSLKVIGQMITGDRSAEDLKGPLGIAKLSGQVTQSGENTSETLHMILWFIAMLSANLGMVNLFPIPMLDGGHLMYYAMEALRGKPLAQKFQEYGFRLGFLIIFSLMAFTLYNDVRQLF